MNGFAELLKGIAEFFKGTAWLIAILGAIKFRKEIARVLWRVIHFRYGDLEIDLETEKTLKEVEEKVEAIEVESSSFETSAVMEGSEVEPEPSFVSLVNDGRVIHTKEYRSLREVARFSPRAAVVGAWSQVESAVDLLAKAAKKVGMKRPLGDVVAFEILKEMEIVSTDMAELYDKLRGVWVKATSDSDFAMEEYDAERYLSVTLRLVARLIELKEKIRRS